MTLQNFPIDILNHICRNIDVSTIGRLHTAIATTKKQVGEEAVSVVSMIPQKHIEESLLHHALKHGESNHVSLIHIKEIFERHHNSMFETDEHGRTLLLCALEGRHDLDTIDYILQITPSKMMSYCDKNGHRAIHYALMKYPNDIKLLVRLVSENSNFLFELDYDKRSIMHHATMNNCCRTILEFLCMFCVCVKSLTLQDAMGKIPLHYGLIFWDTEVEIRTSFLLSKTGNILYDEYGVGSEGNILSYTGYYNQKSLLMDGASNMVAFETLKILSALDPAIVAMKNADGHSVLFFLVIEKYDEETILFFARMIPDCIHEACRNKNTLLHFAACMKCSADIIRTFCGSEGEIFRVMNDEGVTPLQMLIENDIDEQELCEFIMMNVENVKIGRRTAQYDTPILMLMKNPRYLYILKKVIQMDSSIILEYSLLHQFIDSDIIDSSFIIYLLSIEPNAVFIKDPCKDSSPLHSLISAGRADMQMVKVLLKHDISQIMHADAFGQTPFQAALYFNNNIMMTMRRPKTIATDVLEHLLKCYENVVFLVDADQDTPLLTAMHNNIDVSIARRLLKLNPRQNFLLNSQQLSPVHTAMMNAYKDEGFLRELLSLNPENMKLKTYQHGETPLHSAVSNGSSMSMIQAIILINHKLVDVISVDVDGNTLLHCLMMRVLYDRKPYSKPTRKRKKGSFSKSQQRQILLILDFLLNNQQHTLSATNSSEGTPLQLAFSIQTDTRFRNHISEIMIQYMRPEDSLVTHGCSGTPLQIAIKNNLPHNLIEKLIQLETDSKKLI